MSHHFLRFTHVSYTYPGRADKALADVSFEILHGQKVAIVGANGAGKSTLLHLCNGLLLPQSGEVNVGDVPVCASTLKLVRQNIGLLFQNPDDQLFMPTVADDVAFGPNNMHLPPDEVERRVNQALADTETLDLRKRSSYSLSGGQKKRVALAAVLALEPSILVMDEPTAGLDPRARRMLMMLIAQFSHTCLIATHDLDLVRHLCSRTLLLCGGILLADAETNAVLDDDILMDKAGMK